MANLTRTRDAAKCFVVHDDDDTAGVYLSLERAIEYIDDWLQEAEVEKTEQDVLVMSGVIWCYRGYEIEQTWLRG